MLTHKTAFSSATGQNYGTSMFSNTEKPFSCFMKPVACSVEQRKEPGKSSENKRFCFYCLDPGHLIVD